MSFRVFKKTSPNGKLTIFLGSRDFVDHVSTTDPVVGVVQIDDSYYNSKQRIFGQLLCSYRYGREEDESMGMQMQKDLYLSSEQVFPKKNRDDDLTKLQDRLLRKLEGNVVPFTLVVPHGAAPSVRLQQSIEERGKQCGVDYIIRLYAGNTDSETPDKRCLVTMSIRKIQFAPAKIGRQPTAMVRKDSMFSSGNLELEVTLDKALYSHGDNITANVSVRNHSNMTVKRIEACIVQQVEMCLFSNGPFGMKVDRVDTNQGCPVRPGRSVQKEFLLKTVLRSEDRGRARIALDPGKLLKNELQLASSTLLDNPDDHSLFGMIVSYMVTVKLTLGSFSGELVAKLPFLLMNPEPHRMKSVARVESTEQLETFRSASVDSLDDLDDDTTQEGVRQRR